jgi:hypothetical protein
VPKTPPLLAIATKVSMREGKGASPKRVIFTANAASLRRANFLELRKAEVRRMTKRRSSQNPPSTHSGV